MTGWTLELPSHLANSKFTESASWLPGWRIGSENQRELLGISHVTDDLKVRIAAWKGLMRLDSKEAKNAVKSTGYRCQEDSR